MSMAGYLADLPAGPALAGWVEVRRHGARWQVEWCNLARGYSGVDRFPSFERAADCAAERAVTDRLALVFLPGRWP